MFPWNIICTIQASSSAFWPYTRDQRATPVLLLQLSLAPLSASKTKEQKPIKVILLGDSKHRFCYKLFIKPFH